MRLRLFSAARHGAQVALMLGASMALAGAAKAQQTAQPTSAEPLLVRIGHVGPTTGGIGHLGQDNERGALLAIEELNAAGTTIGGRKVRFELVAQRRR